MNGKRKVCVFTSSRAEFGLLTPLLYELKNSSAIDLQLIVSGAHLSPEFGLTVSEVKQHPFEISREIEILVSSDTKVGIGKSFGVGMISFSEALHQLSPDITVVLGDRFEGLAFGVSCCLMGIPIAHIAGGDVTEGAFDNQLRHCLTKLSSLHFTGTELARRRVIQMGEPPNRVFSFGALGRDMTLSFNRHGIAELERLISARLMPRFYLLTIHPVTLEPYAAIGALQSLLSILEQNRGDFSVVASYANADPEGRELNRILDAFAARNSDWFFVRPSLGHNTYMSLMALCSGVLGNSSSGISEAPSFSVPTLNIGNRQRGREMATSIVSCGNSRSDILNGLEQINDQTFRASLCDAVNPYGNGGGSAKILRLLESVELDALRIKGFNDLADRFSPLTEQS